MEIIVSVFSAAVALSCLFAIVRSDLKDRRKAATRDAKIGGSDEPNF